MNAEDRETLRRIATQLRGYTASTPDLEATLKDHARTLDSLAVQPGISSPLVISNEPRGHGGPFGGRRR
jgi:hypothetical protein